MTKSEKNSIIKWANTLTDEELEEEYYRAVYDTLGGAVADFRADGQHNAVSENCFVRDFRDNRRSGRG